MSGHISLKRYDVPNAHAYYNIERKIWKTKSLKIQRKAMDTAMHH